MILNETTRRGRGSVWSAAAAAVLLATFSLGCAAVRPGCGCAVGCAVEPGCGCEPGCAVEPGCGCSTSCGGGCSYAGQKWCGDCGCAPCKPLINVCEGPCSCGVDCDPGCGCEPGCAVEPGCGCEPTCGVGGCGGTCGCRNCPVAQGLAFGVRSIGAEIRCLLSPLGLCCPNGSCGGCGELYWNEWHSDPPACCDPCDDCANWVGPPGAGVNTPPATFEARRVAKRPDAGPRLH